MLAVRWSGAALGAGLLISVLAMMPGQSLAQPPAGFTRPPARMIAPSSFSAQKLLQAVDQNAVDQNKVNGQRSLLVPVAVFGKDQRKSLPKKYKSLNRQIGLLHNSRTNTLCTAFCAGPDVIITASHCLFSHERKISLHLPSFLFKLDTTTKNRFVYSRLAGYRKKNTRRYIITGTSKLSRKPPIGATRDWAIVRLQRPICKNDWLKIAPLSYRQLKKASDKKKLFQVAYHMDFRNWQIAYSRSCSVDRDYGSLKWRNIKKHFVSPKALVLHQCDTGEASSGSPLLMDSRDGPVVVGINVGTYQQRDITVKDGHVIKRSKFKTIANTAVSSRAFARNVEALQQAQVLDNMNDMKQLQASLREHGYYHSSIDGIYGSRTELAIKAFQRATSLPTTGLATRSILATLDKRRSNPASINTSAGHNK